MSEKYVTRLQAMHHSGQLSSFIVSTLPQGKLNTGWIEQGLLGKGFTGNIQDKKIQEDLVIPIDRFSRLTLDYDKEINNGLFILGEQGLEKTKLITLVENENVIGFRSTNIKTSELLGIIARFMSHKTDSKISSDPKLDYVEDLLTDAANGHLHNLLSLSLPSGKSKITDWIREILKTDLKSKAIMARFGDIQKISSSVILLSRWLLALEIFKKTKNAVATILLVQDTQIVFVFWDSPQNIATFGVINGNDVGQTLMKYCLPLWYTSTIDSDDKPKGPKVVIEKQKRKKSKTQKKALPDEPIVPDQVTPDDRTVSIVRTRLVELTNRFAPIVTHLNVLEKRVIKITRDTRFQSMSEHSENAIEELRRIEKETKILEDLSRRLHKLEKQI